MFAMSTLLVGCTTATPTMATGEFAPLRRNTETEYLAYLSQESRGPSIKGGHIPSEYWKGKDKYKITDATALVETVLT